MGEPVKDGDRWRRRGCRLFGRVGTDKVRAERSRMAIVGATETAHESQPMGFLKRLGFKASKNEYLEVGTRWN
jgi:hypothetical protein